MNRIHLSLTERTLLHIAVAVGLIIVVATTLTFFLVFKAIEQRGLLHLEQYVAERANREQASLVEITNNLIIVKKAFLERLAAPDPPGYLEQFDKWFERCPDGAVRSRREYSDTYKYSTLWAHKDTVFTPELKRRVLIQFEICQRFIDGWVHNFRSLYAITPEVTNIGFDPLIPNWVYDAKADYPMNSEPYVAVATPEGNPNRTILWTASLLEPVSGEYFVSVMIPVDVDGRYIGAFGHDIRVEQLMAESIRANVAGLTHMIFRDDGRIIAHPQRKKEILESNGQFAMDKSGDPELASLFQAVSRRRERQVAAFDPGSGNYFAVSRLAGPEWFFLTTMPRTLVLQQAFQSAQWVLWTGLISLALALLFLSVILRRQIARPVGQLLEVTRRMGAGEAGVRVQMDRQDELGRLASAFNLMAQSVAERDAALRQLNQNLERRVEERTTELKGSEARLRTIIEHNPEAVVVFDVDANRFIEVNESAVRMFGLPREKLLQIGPLEVSPTSQPDGRPSKDSAREKIQAALAGHTPPFEWTHRTGDGIDLPCEVRLARVPVDSCNRIIATLIDITERKQAETGLLKALAREKELGELKSNFVSMVSHEFRTPLEIIISSADILQRYLDRLAPEKRLSYLEAIQTSVKRMDKVMEEVLLLSKVEAGGIEFKPVLFDLPAFCRRTADEILFATKHRNPIQLHIDGVPDEVHGDEALLRPVFLNLLSNAVKYSPPGKAVKFEVAFKPDGPTEFRVSDQGCGIPPADQERLFQAFHRGRNVGQIPGTGLGLVIVKRCLELHGGEIRCDSTEGAGTIFTVTVALAQTAEALSCGARS